MDDVLFYASMACVLGHVLIARSPRGVCAILLGDESGELVSDLAVRFPGATLVENRNAVDEDLAKVLRYLQAPRDGLRLTLDMRGTPFQCRVWEKLRAIPMGTTATYSDVAGWIHALASPRAVARACAANPIALAIPCHRVVRKSGDLAGYRWGLARKRELLKKESEV
jgi:methylated-DNA-[protein]-cysteine S-methyltransferase/AraC family transcriptional regulator of adaptative response/methylated-DNA-[protein]-cysteine methyltransferase